MSTKLKDGDLIQVPSGTYSYLKSGDIFVVSDVEHKEDGRIFFTATGNHYFNSKDVKKLNPIVDKLYGQLKSCYHLGEKNWIVKRKPKTVK